MDLLRQPALFYDFSHGEICISKAENYVEKYIIFTF